jgi:tetratricopeptide (TPR) repeat protein
MPHANATEHLDPADFLDFIEGRLARSRKLQVEAHLDRCTECVESLGMIARADRPATREEQSELARVPNLRPSDVLERLRPAIAASGPFPGKGALQWKPLLAAAITLLALGAGIWRLYEDRFLPARSRRIAQDTLAGMIALRQATGRIPLRYIHELEQASVTRSGFDERDPAEEVLLSNLRAAIARAPAKEAVSTLALLLLDEGELDEAERLFREVLEEDPESVDALNGLAVVHYEKAQRDPEVAYGLLQQGLLHLRKAQAAGPEDLRVLYNFGRFYEALEMNGAAIQAWNRYLQKDASSQWAEEAAYQLAQMVPR